jgi:hypothetical protein
MTAERLSSEVGSNASTFTHHVAWSCTGTSPAVSDQRLDGIRRGSAALYNVLEKLQSKEIPGKKYVKEYLCDQRRRHCRPNTLHSSLSSISLLLSFIHRSGKSHPEEITREDLFTFIEHEQDRGMKPSTVNTRVRTLKAFIGFLVDVLYCPVQIFW